MSRSCASAEQKASRRGGPTFRFDDTADTRGPAILASENIQSAYCLCNKSRGGVLSSAFPRVAGSRPVPSIVTEIPGPKARAHVAFDEAWTCPSLPRAYPIVPVRGDGLTVEDID